MRGGSALLRAGNPLKKDEEDKEDPIKGIIARKEESPQLSYRTPVTQQGPSSATLISRQTPEKRGKNTVEEKGVQCSNQRGKAL